MAWNTKWPDKFQGEEDLRQLIEDIGKLIVDTIPKVYDDTVLQGQGFVQDEKHVPLEKVYSNLSPTHDPYTNPNAQIYYECSCGAILDPGTKSFAALNNCASDKGWKIRFNERGYTPYCVECGKGVE